MAGTSLGREASRPGPSGRACYLKEFGVVDGAECPLPVATAGLRLSPLYVRYDALPESISVCVCGGTAPQVRDPFLGGNGPWPLWRVEHGNFAEHAASAIKFGQEETPDHERGVVGCALGLFPAEVRAAIQVALAEGRKISMGLNLRFRRDPFDARARVAISSLQEAARHWNATLVVQEFPPPFHDPLVGPPSGSPSPTSGTPPHG